MLANMEQVYATAGIGVEILSTENLNLPLLNNLIVGSCAGTTTSQQVQLFNNRNNVGDNEIVIYFIQTTSPLYNGCATYPDGKPGAVVTQNASGWTLAHEIGHILGLDHIAGENVGGMCMTPDPTRLMTGCSTSRITATPTLSAIEMSAMRRSELSNEC